MSCFTPSSLKKNNKKKNNKKKNNILIVDNTSESKSMLTLVTCELLLNSLVMFFPKVCECVSDGFLLLPSKEEVSREAEKSHDLLEPASLLAFTQTITSTSKHQGHSLMPLIKAERYVKILHTGL